MNLFLFLACPSGDPVAEDVWRGFGRHRSCRNLSQLWGRFGSACMMVATDDSHDIRPEMTCFEGWHGVGWARLDNREEVEAWAGARRRELSDLNLIVRTVANRGERGIAAILGDFSFVVCNGHARTLVAARDALGVRRLFYTRRNDMLAFSSRAELLTVADDYDTRFLVEMASGCEPSGSGTAYTGVHQVPAGSSVRVHGGHLAIDRFWTVDQFKPTPVRPCRERESCDRFRDLFLRSIALRVTGGQDVWAQLSGGLDSSSVVSGVEHLARGGVVSRGVAGTVSWVYRWSTDGDERSYSNAVAQHHQLRNEVLKDIWFWQESDLGPPVTDQPDSEYPLYSREQSVVDVVRRGGGRVLLTGMGSDNYLLGNMFFFADLLARGRVATAIVDMARRAAAGRVSFWKLAYENAVLPLLPRVLQSHLVSGWSPPPWIERRMVRSYGLRDRSVTAISYRGPTRDKYGALVREAVRGVATTLVKHEILEAGVDVRHPFLYRPLVEFGLALPWEMCVRPHARKWVLREAMRGILPEVVRNRVGKGLNSGCITRSLVHERARVDRMLKAPLLADLNCIDPHELRAAVVKSRDTGDPHLAIALLGTLALETWLQVRSGRWIR